MDLRLRVLLICLAVRAAAGNTLTDIVNQLVPDIPTLPTASLPAIRGAGTIDQSNNQGNIANQIQGNTQTVDAKDSSTVTQTNSQVQTAFAPMAPPAAASAAASAAPAPAPCFPILNQVASGGGFPSSVTVNIPPELPCVIDQPTLPHLPLFPRLPTQLPTISFRFRGLPLFPRGGTEQVPLEQQGDEGDNLGVAALSAP